MDTERFAAERSRDVRAEAVVRREPAPAAPRGGILVLYWVLMRWWVGGW
jgi:hypothetical protein